MDYGIADELIAMAELDLKVCDELATSGTLYEGYDPRMAAIHEKNALRLQAIIAQIGWPAESLVGERAAKAAWLIAQHAISPPEFQRSCLSFLPRPRASTRSHSGSQPCWRTESACSKTGRSSLPGHQRSHR